MEVLAAKKLVVILVATVPTCADEPTPVMMVAALEDMFSSNPVQQMFCVKMSVDEETSNAKGDLLQISSVLCLTRGFWRRASSSVLPRLVWWR